MNLKQTFGICDSKINWRYPISMGIALIIPHLILITFLLITRRFLILPNAGILPINSFVHNSIIEIICYLILVVSLVLFLRIDKIPIYISIVISAVLSRIPDFSFDNQLIYIFLNILTNFLLIVLYQNFLKRFQNPIKGLIFAFLLTITFDKILSLIIEVSIFYRQFGKVFFITSIENGVLIQKLISYVSSGLILTLLFAFGLLISYRFIIKEK